MTDEELRDLLGIIGYREYSDASSQGKKEVEDLASRIRDLSDEEFVQEAASAIYDSALMMGHRGNFEHVHAQVSLVHVESNRRQVLAGHEERCPYESLYIKAHSQAMRMGGHNSDPNPSCTCGKD